jgi:hypothetical protein
MSTPAVTPTSTIPIQIENDMQLTGLKLFVDLWGAGFTLKSGGDPDGN